MKDLYELAQQCQNDLLSVGIRCGNVRSWSVNSRAKARWGLCKKVGRNIYDIQIAEALLQDNVSDQAAKDTIAHELIHTVPGCFSHTKMEAACQQSESVTAAVSNQSQIFVCGEGH